MARQAIAKLINISVPGFTDRDPDFAVRSVLGSEFCRSHENIISEAKQIAQIAKQEAARALHEGEGEVQEGSSIPAVLDLRAPATEADQYLTEHLSSYRSLNILGTVVGGGARPAGGYLNGASQAEVLAKIKDAGYTTVLSIDQTSDSHDLGVAIRAAGLQHEISPRYNFPDWTYAGADLFKEIKAFVDAKTRQGEKVFIHCGAGNGRTGSVLSALSLSHLITAEQARREAIGQPPMSQNDFGESQKVSVTAEYLVQESDIDDDNLEDDEPKVIRQQTAYDLPLLAAQAILAVRNVALAQDPKDQAVETNHQLVDVANFAAALLPPAPAMVDPRQLA